MAKSLETLVTDIYELFNTEITHEPDEDNLNDFAENLKETLRIRLREREDVRNPLRFSSLGKPDRQVWFMAHDDGTAENLSPKTFMKFLIGDVFESLILFMAKEAGHSVERQQEEIVVDGVKGHIDAIIDGVVVDVKTASPFGYKKFEKQNVIFDDPFGYVQQLAGYASVLTPGEQAAWLAYDKVSGDICVSPLSSSIIKDFDPGERIQHLKEVIDLPNPPERCYSDEEDGKSGNRKLGTACSYCPHKFRCWNNLRVFAYSTGPKFLTKVSREPDVPELKGRKNPDE